jgi:hypothetical protein
MLIIVVKVKMKFSITNKICPSNIFAMDILICQRYSSTGRTKQTKLTANNGRVTIHIQDAMEPGHVLTVPMRLSAIQPQNVTLIAMSVYRLQLSKLYVCQWIALETEISIVLEQLTKENIVAVCIRDNLGGTIAAGMTRHAQPHRASA